MKADGSGLKAAYQWLLSLRLGAWLAPSQRLCRNSHLPLATLVSLSLTQMAEGSECFNAFSKELSWKY